MIEDPSPYPKVSILIPVYNRENYLPECIQSALDQTFVDLEIVISDNASTDMTWEICKDFAKKDSRVRIFRNETNIGPLRNWLRCVSEARGQYIKILFSDDLMFPHFLEHTLPYLEDEEIAFVSTAVIIGESPDKGHSEYVPKRSTVILSRSVYLKRLIYGQAPFSPGAGIFRIKDVRKNLLTTIPVRIPHDFPKHGAGPDVLLYALTSIAYKKVAMLPQWDVFFRAHPESIFVCDADKDIYSAYGAALAWFFRKNENRRFWFRYVALIWVQGMARARHWISLRRYCINHEGDGSIAEMTGITWYSFQDIIAIVLMRLKRISQKIRVRDRLFAR
jgi:glycosyltransferase involved in cell wall biosynthesis